MIVFLKQGTGRGVVEHVGNLLAERSLRSLAVWMGRTVSEPPASALADLDVRLADVPLAAAGTAPGTRS